jgi:OOP family OmpA-OmpF porin
MSRIPRIAPVALFALAAVLVVPRPAAAVNLVPNPSFELYAGCPTGFSQFFQAVAWNLPNAGTSDLFNTCSPGGFPSVNVPSNTIGFQNALTGSGYAGIIPYSAAPDYREYVQAPLSSALVNGGTYQVSFWVSLGDTSMFALDRLGAYLSVGQVGPLAGNTTLLVTPQVESPANVYLNDTVNWMQVSGTFVAAGGEDHIVIGSFRDDANTNLVPGPDVWPGGAYYYIDDVSVELVNTNVDQACCLPDGQCVTLLPGECQALGGTPLGAGVACGSGGGDDPCGPTPARPNSWGRVKGIYR